MTRSFFAHPSSFVDEPTAVGEGTRIWHFSHISEGAVVGKDCVLGQNVFVAQGAVVGDRVRIQNNVSVYGGVVLEDDVFVGPSAVFTNVANPRAEIDRRGAFATTRLRRGVTVGANATVVCGLTVGRYAFIGAGAVVTRDVADYALVLGVPARPVGFVGRHGRRLTARDDVFVCPESGYRYRAKEGRLACLDLDEDDPLPGGRA